jgi:hypothetical protein
MNLVRFLWSAIHQTQGTIRTNCNTKTTLWLLKVNVTQGRSNLKLKRAFEESSTALFV